MSVKLYMDHQVSRAITEGLRLRGVDVLTALEDGAQRLDDPELLDRASALNCLLFSQDVDLLREATKRQREGESFGGVVYARQRRVTIWKCIEDLELIAKACDPADFANRVEYLPLR